MLLPLCPKCKKEVTVLYDDGLAGCDDMSHPLVTVGKGMHNEILSKCPADTLRRYEAKAPTAPKTISVPKPVKPLPSQMSLGIPDDEEFGAGINPSLAVGLHSDA